MSDEYGNDFITLTDEDGNEFEVEHLDTLEYEGKIYMAFEQVCDDPQEKLDDAGELIILSVDDSGDDEMLVTVDDEELLNKLFEMFVERLESEQFGDEDEEEADFSEDEQDK